MQASIAASSRCKDTLMKLRHFKMKNKDTLIKNETTTCTSLMKILQNMPVVKSI
jgi:hypothetical protein